MNLAEHTTFAAPFFALPPPWLTINTAEELSIEKMLPPPNVYLTPEGTPLVRLSDGELPTKCLLAVRALEHVYRNPRPRDNTLPKEAMYLGPFCGSTFEKLVHSLGRNTVDFPLHPAIHNEDGRRRLAEEHLRHLRKSWRRTISSFSKDNKAYQFRHLFEGGLHVRRDPATFFALSDIFSSYLNLDWNKKLALRKNFLTDQEIGLINAIRESGGVIPFDRYFELAMFSAFGTYNSVSAEKLISKNEKHRGSPIFETISQHPEFAEQLLDTFFDTWRRLGCPKTFDVVEMGPGIGTLAVNLHGILRERAESSTEWRSFKDAQHYHMVERNESLHAYQVKKLSGIGANFYLGNASESEIPTVQSGVFFSVELLDMLPLKIIVRIHGKIWEVYVTEIDGLIQEIMLRPSNETLEYFSRHPLPAIPEGKKFFFRPDIDKLIEHVGSHVVRGAHMMIDYFADTETIITNWISGFRRYPYFRERDLGWLDNLTYMDMNWIRALEEMDTRFTCIPSIQDWTGDVNSDAVTRAIKLNRRPSHDVTSVSNDELRKRYKCEILVHGLM